MKKVLTVLILCLGCQMIAAQKAPKLPSKVKVGKPEILVSSGSTYKYDDLMRVFNEGNKWGIQKTSSKFYWNVFSDRANNPLYSDASKTKILDNVLGFKQKVIIAEVKNNMALVYEDPKMENFPEIPSYAKSLGWIPIENLLLWEKCPTDEHSVQRKALIAINLREAKEIKDFYYYYDDPVKDDDSTRLNMDMQYYFIMKETPNGSRVLLSTASTLENGRELLGWVDREVFSRWDQRACLEPNWDTVFVDKHKGKGKQVDIYQNKSMSEGGIVASWEYGRSNDDKERQYRYRMFSEQLRYPILDKVNEENDWIHCTVFSDNTRKANFDDDSRSITNYVNRIRQMRKQMNIIFAVEASTDMREVLPAIRESIEKCNSFGGQGYVVRVGVVLYRGSSQGIKGIERVELCSFDDPELLSMFDKAKANYKLSGKSTMALSSAIEQATDAETMGFNKDQNNLLVVIGSHGAPDNDKLLPFSDEVLISPDLQKRLNDNNIQVLIIQVEKGSDGSKVNFNNQMVELMHLNVQNQYVDKGDSAIYTLRSQQDGYSFVSWKSLIDEEYGGSVLFSQIRYPQDFDRKLTAQEITKYLDNGINKFAETIENWITHFEESLRNIQFDPDFLKDQLGVEGFERWKKKKAITAYDGFALKNDLEGLDYWHYILYLSKSEFRTLLVNMRDAYDEAKKEEPNRGEYIDAMRSLIKAQYGQLDDKTIDAKDADELQEMIYGLNVRVENKNIDNKRYSLKEIQDPGQVSNGKFADIMIDFVEKYEELRKIYEGNYNYITKIGNEYYYWIPIEYLP